MIPPLNSPLLSNKIELTSTLLENNGENMSDLMSAKMN